MVETLVKKHERREMQTLETTRVFFKKKQKNKGVGEEYHTLLPSQMKSITFFYFVFRMKLLVLYMLDILYLHALNIVKLLYL